MKKRSSKYRIKTLLLNSDSSSEMADEKISKKELMTFFEDARLEPSSYTFQLWIFIYTTKDGNMFSKFLNLSNPGNMSWKRNANTPVVVATRKDFEYDNKVSRTTQFDFGAVCQNLSLKCSSVS
jgi:nitroreductase